MGIRKKYRWGKNRVWLWFCSLLGEPMTVRPRPVPAQYRQEAAACPLPENPACHDPGEDEIDFLRIWQMLWRGRRFIILFTLIPTLLAVLNTLFIMPVTYKSEAVLMPTEQQGGGLGGMASLASSLPFPISLPGGGKSDQILTFLQSRNLQQRLIEKYTLLPRWHEGIWDGRQNKWLISEAERKALLVRALQGGGFKGAYTVKQDKTNLITIEWVDTNPAFAAEMLKRVIAELSHYLNNEYESDAMRERQFVEKQLAQSAKDLEHWERQIPMAKLPLAEIQRERLAAQTVYAELRKQLELSKISEAKELIRFKVLDPPFIPEQKFKPNRRQICTLTLLASAMLSMLIIFSYHAIMRKKEEDAPQATQ